MGYYLATYEILGGIHAARGPEMYLPLWLSLIQVLGTSDFNLHIVRH